MVNSKFPVVIPPVFPVSVNPPVSVPPEEKQGVAVVKVKLVPVIAVLLL